MPSLAKVVTGFEKACTNIDRRIAFALALPEADLLVSRFIVSMCVVKLHDQWNARCRELILKSAMGRYRTLSGMVLKRAVRENPIQKLRHCWSTKRPMDSSWEPDWHMPGVSARAASLLGIQNCMTVTNAVSAITTIEELRWTRNAVAHELPRSYTMFRRLRARRVVAGNDSPADYAVRRVEGTSDLIIDVWMSELKLALKAAIQ